ncbi:hypothetical protein E5288_WYG019903 [Bos mutus]|uniref:Uncharacterized protein n=1 Tax=Bos mutus TaxID=72004 RepID=A0A6B0RNF0_9CETA|nr:hypothetical protein [Bos mutus]
MWGEESLLGLQRLRSESESKLLFSPPQLTFLALDGMRSSFGWNRRVCVKGLPVFAELFGSDSSPPRPTGFLEALLPQTWGSTQTSGRHNGLIIRVTWGNLQSVFLATTPKATPKGSNSDGVGWIGALLCGRTERTAAQRSVSAARFPLETQISNLRKRSCCDFRWHHVCLSFGFHRKQNR